MKINANYIATNLLSVSKIKSQKDNPNEDSEEKFKVKDISQITISTADDRRIKQEIIRLKQWENHVIAHETAHINSGGGHIGSASYVYTYGPDGRKYVAGGAVSIKIPQGFSYNNIAKLKQLKRAAIASTDASPQDLASAGMISAVERSRTQKLNLRKIIKTYEKNKRLLADEKINNGEEIFVYKSMDISNDRLLELFV